MKRYLLALALLLPVLTYAQKKAATSYDLVVGTYTKGESKGIVVYRFYPESGKLSYLSQVETSNPSYVCVSKNNKFIYAVNEDGKDGGVSAFTFDPHVGTMKLINKQSSAGADPCYISVDEDQKFAFVANYSSGSLAVLPVNKDGSLAPASQVIQDQGKGPDASRQEGPHMHISYLTDDEKFLLANDLGIDRLNIFRYHSSRPQPLTPSNPPFITLKGGTGPRHLVLSADKKYLYLLQEMGSAITVYDFDGGKPKELQTVKMLPDNFKGTNGAAAIKISPDGHFLVATDRLDASSILVYSINPDNGQLTFMTRSTTYGKNPRDFTFDPTGKWLLVANQDSDNIVIFKFNEGTGALSTTGNSIQIGNPVCLKFTEAE